MSCLAFRQGWKQFGLCSPCCVWDQLSVQHVGGKDQLHREPAQRARPQSALQHLSEGFSRTCNLSRAFGSPGTRGRFGFLRLLKWMELVTSWKHNGSHCHSHPLSCTRTNPPKPKGTARNTSFVFGAGSQGRIIERHK